MGQKYNTRACALDQVLHDKCSPCWGALHSRSNKICNEKSLSLIKISEGDKICPFQFVDTYMVNVIIMHYDIGIHDA